MSTGLNNNILPQCREKKKTVVVRSTFGLFQNHLQLILIKWVKCIIFILLHMGNS